MFLCVLFLLIKVKHRRQAACYYVLEDPERAVCFYQSAAEVHTFLLVSFCSEKHSSKHMKNICIEQSHTITYNMKQWR